MMDFPSSPTTGQTYSVSGGPTYVYNGTAWVVLTPGNQFNRTVFTATAGQTTFSMSYVVGAVDVYRNGVKLVNTSDFTATNGTSIVLLNAATVGDTIEVISYPMITYSDAVRRTGDTMTGALAVPSLTVNSVPVLAGPAFASYAPGTQSVSLNTYTTLILNNEYFDTANAFSTSNYRFSPQVSGYYSFQFACNSTQTTGILFTDLRKNGSRVGISSLTTGTGYEAATAGASLVYMNGSTDYVELQVYSSVAMTVRESTYLSGVLVRAA